MEGTSLNKRRIGEATLETLRKRGLIDNISDPQGVSNLSGGTLYCGFDPTARSLHIGNLVPFMLMMQLARAGADIAPIVILGGATGSIGDPSGRSQERNLLSLEEVNKNTKHIEQQFLKLAASAGQKITVLNNYDWTHTLSVLDFLRDVGKYFPVNYMLQKETVKTRLDGDGFSFTEFSYMLLQAYDFLHLHQNYNCRLQVGGSDQWGNITAGLELVRRKLQGGEVYAMSTPLLLDSQGRKLGKKLRKRALA
jgi:tyrosyl-tRNA synthetase